MQRKIDRLVTRLQAQLDTLESLLPETTTVVSEVSKWSIGEHLEHCVLALARTGEGFERALASGPQAVPGGPSLAGRVILWLGIIPRGKGKAPVAVRPQNIDRPLVAAALNKERQRWSTLAPRIGELQASGWRLPHPIFGPLSATQWLRFNEVHLHHHLKVVADIQKAS